MDLAALRPMLAVPGREQEVRTGHRYEFKWDGVRALVGVDTDGRLQLRSRNGVDVTARYPELTGLADAIGRPAVLDGEVVAFDEQGRPSFAALQPRMHLADPTRAARAAAARPVALLLFDLLSLDGDDRLAWPQQRRRAALAELELAGGGPWSVPPDTDDLDAALTIARARDLEGVVAKRLDAPYRPGVRSNAWVKLRLARRQEVVVGGWRPGKGHRSGRIGSLLVGVHDATGLRYAGGVGSGLSEREIAALEAALTPRRDSPFVDPVEHRDACFADPELVIDVRFTEWTPDGRLRHPVYLGRRADKAAGEVVRET
ncbi:non-homologous end-joining DNA ligase [Egicoccus halophilus]|uniref:DNA ligase (ATP) n=1 Tax=Egicoccus halophilus TaxID=1670830 RepID=A0A8J3A9Q4_9ACTN|nr:non-homologous end-joining DNA ligase [Egicoccus halophilus]GGI05476.1 ATP-dependent DNA ligase [Egicoccus halophilus]